MKHLKNCTTTTDALCLCPDGTFLNKNLHHCDKCSECDNGHRVSRKCAREEDTKCEACPDVSITTQKQFFYNAYTERDQPLRIV